MSRIPWKKFLGVVAIAMGFAIGWKVFSIGRGPKFEYRYASASLPAVEKLAAMSVTFFREQDWCKVLEDAEGTFANTDRSTCALKVEPKDVHPLEGAALERWKQASAIVATMPYAVHWIDVTRGPDGKLAGAELSLATWGRETLVYSKAYNLPADEPNERVHTAIDGDWYHYWEDWN